MALHFKIKPIIGNKYSRTIYDSINQLLGLNLEGWMTATYPAYGNKNGINAKFKEANEILLFGKDWINSVSFKTHNKPDALEGSNRVIHLFIKENGYYFYRGRYVFDKRLDDVIYLKKYQICDGEL